MGVAGNLAEQHRREEVTRWLRARMGMTPRVGLILGSGLGQLGDRIEAPVHLPYHSIPGWPVATAVGHAGNLIAGRLAGVPVVALQGRFHLYEGYSWAEVTRPIHVLSELGISALIVSNAAGGLNPQFRCGDLMLIDGHLNLMLGSAPPAASSEPGVAWSRRQSQTLSPYCGKWMRDWERLARAENMTLRRGVYVGVSGPNYETRAEYRALRRLGADAVGMSTVPEVCRGGSLQPAGAWSLGDHQRGASRCADQERRRRGDCPGPVGRGTTATVGAGLAGGMGVSRSEAAHRSAGIAPRGV